MSDNQLAITEQTELTACEAIIEKGLQTFIEVGSALMSVRDNQLYRAQYPTFEAYCDQRWGMKQSRSYQLMDAARVMSNLQSSTIVELPTNEAQVRPLVSLSPDQQRANWQEAVETAPNGKPTGAHVAQVVSAHKPINSVPARVGSFDPDIDQQSGDQSTKLSTPTIILGAQVRYNDHTYTAVGASASSVTLETAPGRPRFAVKVTEVEVVSIPKPIEPSVAAFVEQHTPQRDALLETHPHYATEGNPALCATCGEYHVRWKAIDGGYWRCLKCEARGQRTEVADEMMEIETAEDRVAVERMSRRRNGSRSNPQHSSESNEYYTPEEYIEAARLVMGGIDLDPASCEYANRIVKAATYFTIDQDGYAQQWFGRAWLNSPYGREGDESNQLRWSARMIRAWQQAEIEQAVTLVNAATGAKWFQSLWDFPLCFTDHRIVFYNEDGPQENPTHYNCFVYFGKNIEAFARVFRKFGRIVLPCGEISGVQL